MTCVPLRRNLLACKASMSITMVAVCLLLALPSRAPAQAITLAPVITTVAGNGTPGFGGDSGAATAAELNSPNSVVIDASGNQYIADYSNNRVREVIAATGEITTIAGNGTAGFSGDGNVATLAELNGPNGVALYEGFLFIADTGNNRIRVVTLTRDTIRTVAGNGTAGYAGDGGAATLAELDGPEGVAVDSTGNVYIADSVNNVVRQFAIGGNITTVAGNHIGGYSGDNGAATQAELFLPVAVALDASGNLYIADFLNQRIRSVNLPTTAVITTVAGTGTSGFNGDTGVATSLELNGPEGVGVDVFGNLYIADTSNARIRVVHDLNSGYQPYMVTLIGTHGAGYSGDGGAAVNASLNNPHGVVLDALQNVYIVDTGNNVLREINAPTLSAEFPATLVSSASAPQNVYLSINSSLSISSISVPSSQGGTPEFVVGGITGCAVDGSTVNPAGTICTVPVSFAPAYAGPRPVPLAVQTSAGSLQVGMTGVGLGPQAVVSTGVVNTLAGGGSGCAGQTDAVGDGCPAGSASLTGPNGVALDAAGNLYTADPASYRIRGASGATGVINTVAGDGVLGSYGDGGEAVAAELDNPYAIAVDAAGNFYIADSYNNTVRKVTAGTGIINTVAGSPSQYGGYSGDGGPATSALLEHPGAVAVDAQGNLFIADTQNNVIRKVTAATGIISTVAGCCEPNGANGYSGDGGPATSAYVSIPWAVAVDNSGNLYFADTGNGVIRVVYAGGVVPGLSGPTPGYIYTVAGNFNANGTFSGDNGPATNAGMNDPEGVILDAAGDIYIADTDNSVLRKIYAATGIITTIAGVAGKHGYNGDGGLATNTYFAGPAGLGLDAFGNLSIADFSNGRVRQVSAAGAPLAFPLTNVGFLSSAQTVVVTNIGNSALTFGGFATSSNFTVDGGATTCSASSFLAAGAFCLVGVDCSPTTSGSLLGTLTIADNALNSVGAEQTVALSCTALYATQTSLPMASITSSTGGQPVAFTVQVAVMQHVGAPPVSPGSPPVAGTVTFFADGVQIGVAGVSLQDTSTLLYTGLKPGTHQITATYSGSSTLQGSTSPPFLYTVAIEPTTTALNLSTMSSTWGQTVELTATVSSTNGATPTGTVSFRSNSAQLGNVSLKAAGADQATATLNTTALPAGMDFITASFTGSNYMQASSSTSTSVTISQTTSTAAVLSSLNPSAAGQAVNFTATVITPTGGVPAGSVSFQSDGATIGAGSLNGSGQATLSYAMLIGGTHSIVASYAGSANAAGSTSATLSQVVNKAASAVTLVSSANPSSGGQAVTLTATIAPVGPLAPTGTVAFSANGATITGCSAGTVTSAHTATCTTTTLAVGTDSIQAVYSGDTIYLASTSAALSQVVNLATTTTTLTSSVNPSTGGQTITFTATVSASGGGHPTGTVTFYNGSTSIGTAAFSSGVATLKYASLVTGTHSITATYNGSTLMGGSTSAAISQVVNLDTTTTVLVPSPNPSKSGEAVAMTATVTPGNGVAATGTVSFYSGSTLLGNAGLSSGVATISHVFATTGTDSLTAKYTGSNYKSASTSTAVTQTVN